MAAGAFSAFEWMLAGRYLRARRKEGFISVIAGFSLAGIGLGVATLIIVMSVMNGFRIELVDRMLGLNGHILVQSMNGKVQDYENLSDKLSVMDGVVSAVPIVEGQILASGPNGSRGGLVRGVRPDDLRQQTLVVDGIKSGSLAAFGREKNVVVVGTRLAFRLGLRLGDKITILSPRGAATPFGTAPRVKAFTIAALFEIGMSEYDSSFIFMPLSDAQKFFNMKNSASAIEIMVERPDDAPDMRVGVYDLVGYDNRVVDWQQLNSGYFSALAVERNVMFLILTLIILVAAFNIISGMIMLVKDKGRDIAILRTMGASRGAVMRVFLISGASIGLTGTFVGVVLGTAFCANIEAIRQFMSSLTGTELFSPEVYFLSQMPAEMDPVEVITVVSMSLGLSFLATLYPSWRAAKLDPVEALRYE